ncbi:MAG: FMN-binding protein [Syntrophales bacterium]|nr:FMN-binding protein [Syntrophales bacterium]NLN60485.1 FMN-binding protein [Deltaproteobacteria bacterium]
MLNITKLGFILGIFCVSAAFALSAVYESTKGKIAYEKEKVMQEALRSVLPEAKNIVLTTSPDGKEYYCGFAGDDTDVPPVGYAIVAAGKGYSSTIQTLVGLAPDGVIKGMNIMYQQETPGLGTKAVEIKYGEKDPWFQRQFIGSFGDTVAVDKDGGKIQCITGSTITSRAIASSIKQEVEWMRSKAILKPVQE